MLPVGARVRWQYFLQEIRGHVEVPHLPDPTPHVEIKVLHDSKSGSQKFQWFRCQKIYVQFSELVNLKQMPDEVIV